MVNRVVSTLAAVAVFLAFVMITDLLSDKVYPHGIIDYKDKQAVAQYVQAMPIKASLFLLFGYGLGTLLGSIVGTIVAGRISYRASILVGIVSAVATTSNAISIGHPTWFVSTGMVLSVAMAALGYIIARKRDPQI